MAVNNKRAVLRLAAGALSLPAAFLLGGCSLRLPQGEAAREPSLLLRWRRLRFRRNR